jgi:hypothetical protein
LRALYRRLEPRIAHGWLTAILFLNWYVLLGAMDDAYDSAQRLVTHLERARRLLNVNVMPIWLPDLVAFRCDPRFHEFTARLGLHAYWKANGPSDGYALQDGRLVATSGAEPMENG